jgi:hypothetical protein
LRPIEESAGERLKGEQELGGREKLAMGLGRREMEWEEVSEHPSWEETMREME